MWHESSNVCPTMGIDSLICYPLLFFVSFKMWTHTNFGWSKHHLRRLCSYEEFRWGPGKHFDSNFHALKKSNQGESPKVEVIVTSFSGGGANLIVLATFFTEYCRDVGRSHFPFFFKFLHAFLILRGFVFILTILLSFHVVVVVVLLQLIKTLELPTSSSTTPKRPKLLLHSRRQKHEVLIRICWLLTMAVLHKLLSHGPFALFSSRRQKMEWGFELFVLPSWDIWLISAPSDSVDGVFTLG